MKNIKNSILSLTILFTLNVASSPNNVKESEYLPGCRKTCQADAYRAGVSNFESITKCDCYCKSVWQKLTNSDVDYFAKNNSFPPSMFEKQRQSFNACFN